MTHEPAAIPAPNVVLEEVPKEEATRTLKDWGVYQPEQVVKEIGIAGFVIARRKEV